MEEKFIIKLSRRIEYLVHKRHRSLRHIQKALSSDGNGVFWMNSVQIDRQVFNKIISQQFSQGDLKVKTERFYYLGFSLGKLIDLGNAVNTIYALLQLFEEYEQYTKQPTGGAQSLEQNAILRHILPINIDSLSRFQQSQEQKMNQMETYVESLRATTDTIHSSDMIDTVRNGHFHESQSPSQLRGGGHINHHGQSVPQNFEESKVEVKHKGALLMQEHQCNSYDEYINQTSHLSNQINQYFGNNAENPGARIQAHKIDPKAPCFKILSCHTLPMRVDYCDVACSLIDMLTLVYNKMYDNQYLNQVMLSYIEKIDNIIVNKVIKSFCEDINKVSRIIAVKQLAKINKVLKQDNISGKTVLKRVPSDDAIFQIAALDLQGNNQSDFKLLNQVVASSSQQQSGSTVMKGGSSENMMTNTYR